MSKSPLRTNAHHVPKDIIRRIVKARTVHASPGGDLEDAEGYRALLSPETQAALKSHATMFESGSDSSFAGSVPCSVGPASFEESK